MKRGLIYSVIYFILFFISCSDVTNDVRVDEFPLISKLASEEISIPPILLSPDNMCIIDSFLIVAQDRNDTMFYIFKIPECNYVKSFGTKGNGPNEFHLSFEHVTLGRVVDRNISAFAVGNYITRIQYYNICDIINENNIEPYKTELLPPEMNYFRAVTYIKDSLIFGAPSGGKMHLFKYNSFDKQIEKVSDYPNEFPFLDQATQRELYGCFLTSKPDNSKIAIAYANIGIIEIYDINRDFQKRINYIDFPSIRDNINLKRRSTSWDFNPDQKYFSGYITSTDQFIYACIYNTKYSIAFDEDGPNRDYTPEIHVFDWNGNPIVKYQLDTFYTYFAVDLEDRYLYTIDWNHEDVIRRFKLPI